MHSAERRLCYFGTKWAFAIARLRATSPSRVGSLAARHEQPVLGVRHDPAKTGNGFFFPKKPPGGASRGSGKPSY